MNYIIKNGYILDENNKEVFVDIRVQDGVIKEWGLI